MGEKSLSLKGKRAVILGFARQGKALARWLPGQGVDVTVSDKRDAGEMADDFLEFLMEPIHYAVGGHPLELLDEADFVCVSGGVPLEIPFIQEARQRNIRITNDAELFLERCPAKVIGITGSAGKTTTTTLVGKMCEVDGKTTWVGGNIGDVLLDDLDKMKADDIVVMELSSFQLEVASVSPPIAAILNITPNHLDRHRTLQHYAAAKANIFVHQKKKAQDLVLLGGDNVITAALEELAPARRAFFSNQRMVTNGAFLLGRRLAVVGNCSPTGEAQIVCEKEDIKLRGEHNLSNVLAACALAGAAGISKEAMKKAIQEFKGVPHRLELVAEIEGTFWVNDSIATAPERVVAALKSFEEPVILLAGGRDKNLPWVEMADLAYKRCRTVIAFGEHRHAIAEVLNYVRRGRMGGRLKSVNIAETLEEAVEIANRLVRRGDVVLLSPGGTSFDAYKDFAERGEHFRKLVEDLKEQRRRF